ncbi:hypothetical protein E4U21_005268 [Claviceps maximensis]|nr:hypothetical protein E4U21_005268 [Claviceps maximensis]
MRILLLNPNSSTAMTESMILAARSTPISSSIQISPMTAPSAPSTPSASSPPSINNSQDIQASTQAILALLANQPDLFREYDGILIACFSVHTLVPELARRLRYPAVPVSVTGIFEASVLTALSLIRPSEQWGIVTTGEFWERHLCEGVDAFLGIKGSTAVEHTKFAGVFSSGLTAGDFHTVSPVEVREKLGFAARRLLLASGSVTCVVMGCGGMAGLEDIIRAAAVEVYNESRAKSLFIIDGVKAGILQLHQTITSGKTFQ